MLKTKKIRLHNKDNIPETELKVRAHETIRKINLKSKEELIIILNRFSKLD